MKTYVNILIPFLTLSLVLALPLPYTLAETPQYIQAGLKFVYQMYDGKTQQPENLFHSYIIESATSRSIAIRIESDVVKSFSIEVDGDGNVISGDGRIDLWIPQNLQVGSRINLMGYDAVVLQKNYDIDGSGKITFTVVSTTDQKTIWLYVDGGTLSQSNQLLGLLFGILFPGTNKYLAFSKVEQVQAATTTKTIQTMTTKMQTTSIKTAIPTTKSTIATIGGTTLTTVATYTVTSVIGSTVTHVSTVTTQILETHITTITKESTATQPTQLVEATTSPLIPLPIAIMIALAIVGGGFFYLRSMKKPLPPTYPYPTYPTQPSYPSHPAIQQPPPPYPQIAGYCPACKYPLYVGDVFCRRCGYRVS